MFGFLSVLALFVKDIYFFVGYIKSNIFPHPLNESEEERYLQLLELGDLTARNKLIEHNLRLVAHIVKKFETKAEVEDLISIGTIGLIKAIESYSTSKGTKLATYAARCIENEILMHFRGNKKSKKDVSLHDPIGHDREGNELTLIDVLGTDVNEVVDYVNLNLEKKRIHSVIHVLDEREREVIVHRFGLGDYDEKTQKEIAKKLGISRSYVSRIEKRALFKLYQELQQKKEI